MLLRVTFPPGFSPSSRIMRFTEDVTVQQVLDACVTIMASRPNTGADHDT